MGDSSIDLYREVLRPASVSGGWTWELMCVYLPAVCSLRRQSVHTMVVEVTLNALINSPYTTSGASVRRVLVKRLNFDRWMA